MPYLLLIAHCRVCSLGLLPCLLIQNYNYVLFFPRKIVLLTKQTDVQFIVLFQFGCFALLVKAYKQFIPKVYVFLSNNILCNLCKTRIVFS